jgi:Recombinase/Recombinase zinc beta ribbon domain
MCLRGKPQELRNDSRASHSRLIKTAKMRCPLIVEHLTKIGAPTPQGKRWTASTVRHIISSDTYLGTFYWGKERYTTTTIPKVYKRKVVKEKLPESEWIAIPVPDSGIPAETIARARESLQGNTRAVSKNGGRIWELSGGVGKCSECGKHMVAHTSRNTAKRTYYYYRCSSRKHHACSNRKNYPARELEMRVEDAIVGMFQEETWGAFVKNACDQKLADLRRLRRGGIEGTKERLAGRRVTLKKKMDRARELFINDEDFSRPEYEEKKAQIQDEIKAVERELSKVDDLEGEIRRWEELRKTLLSVNNPLDGLSHGSQETAAGRRQGFYQRSGVRVEVGEETLQISLGVDRISVCNNESDSGVISAPAPAGVPGSLSRPRS